MKTFSFFALTLYVLLNTFSSLFAAAIPINCNSDVSGTIGTNGEFHEYTFDGQTGEKVIIRMQGELFLDPKIELFGPNGTLLTKEENTSDGLARIGLPSFPLNATGPYTIRVSDFGNNNTGNYGLSLQILRNDCATAISCDADIAANFTQMAEMDAYSFQGMTGERIILRMQGDLFLDPAMELYGPDGKQVAQHLNDADGLARIGNPTFTLPADGTYILVVMDDEGSQFDDYGLSSQFINPTCATALACDVDINANFTRLAEIDAYSFEGMTGERIILRMQGDLFLDPAIELYGPNGQLVAQSLNDADGLARIGSPSFVLPADGTYILVVMDDEGSQFDDYGLSIQFIKPTCATALACDIDINNNFTRLAEMDAYSFQGMAGERIIMRMQGDLFLDPAIELYGPNGQLVSQSLNDADGLARIGNPSFVLPADGTYILVVMDDEGSQFDDYGLSIQFIKPTCATALACDADINNNFTRLAEMDAYSFQGMTGELIMLRMQGDLFLDPAIEIYGPNGQIVAQSLNDADGLARIGSPTFMLPADGTYIIVVMDDEGSQFDDYGLSLQFIKPACANALNCDTDMSALFTKLAEINAYSFQGLAGERIILRMQGDLFLDPAIELYGPNGQLVAQSLDDADGLARIGSPAFKLPADGTYIIVVMDDEGSQFDDYGLSLQFIKPACATLVACDADVAANFTKLAEMDGYYFSGHQGDRILLRMQGALFLDPAIELYGPDSLLVGQKLNDADGLVRLGVLTLPADGTYFVVVMDDEGSNFDDYNLSIQVLGVTCAQPVLCAEDITNTINTIADMDGYYFNGQAGERVIIQSIATSVSLDLDLEMYGPVGNSILKMNSSGASILARIDTFTLPQSGPYFLVVMDNDGANTGTYSLSVQLLRTACTQWLGCNGDAGASIDKPAEMDAYAFLATQGQKIRLRSSETVSVLKPEIKIYRRGQGGEVQAYPNANGLFDVTFTAPATDTFFLVYRDLDGRNTGAYGLSIQVLDAGCAAPFACTLDTATTLGFPAEMDAYRISGDSGRAVLMRAVTPGFVCRLDIYNKTGDLVDSFENNTGLLQRLWKLPQGGDYLVVLLAKNGTSTGNYGFSCQTIDQACADSALVGCGYALAASIKKTAQVQAYALNLPANQGLVLRATPPVPGIDLRIDLYNTATGLRVDSADMAGNVVTLDFQSGSPVPLLAVVTDKEGDEPGDYYLSFQFAGETANCGNLLNCATHTATASLDMPAAIRTFTFTAEPGFRGIIRLSEVNNSIVEEGRLYDPQGNYVPKTPALTGHATRFNLESLPLAGKYTFVVADQNGKNTGDVAVAFENLRDMNCGESVAYNTDLLKSLANRAEMVSLIVQDAAAGDKLVAQGKGVLSSFNAQIEVYNAAGALLKQDSLESGGLYRVNALSLAFPGKYKILVMENDGDETGPFGFSGQKVNPGANAIPLPPTGFITATLDYPAASDVYTFSANTGNVVSFEMNSINPAIKPRLELYTQNGARLPVPVTQTTSSAKVIHYTLPASGIFTILAMDDNGADTGSYQIGNLEIITPPTAGFTATNTIGCAPLTVQFHNTSSANATSYQWSFPGGTPGSSTAKDPVVTYATGGVYSVTLTAINLAGSSADTQFNIIVVKPKPTSGFTATVNSPVVIFTNTSVNADEYKWDFGDGKMSTEKDPVHVYADCGIYTVTLTTTNDCGTSTISKPITVAGPPEAKFNIGTSSGCAPLAVQFVDNSTCVPSSRQWSFPGGSPSSSTEKNPVVTYTNSGTYTVSLTVVNAFGSDTRVETFTVQVTAPPISAFTYDATGLEVTFDNNSTNANDFTWNFGDGTTSTEADPVHIYPDCRSYTVTLTAKNACGTNISKDTITVEGPPEAKFNIGATSGCGPLAVKFTNNSTCGPSTFQWLFLGGSPSSSSDPNPVVTYNQSGTYTAILTVTNATGSSTKMDTFSVQVAPVPQGDFIAQSTGFSVQFKNLSTNANSYFWDFGDGTTSTEKDPMHVYSTCGNFFVRLIALNDCAADTISKSVFIDFPLPTADFEYSINSDSVLFTNKSQNGVNYSWDFGDGQTDTLISPLHIYTATGSYTVTLIVKNPCGVEDIIKKEVMVVVAVEDVSWITDFNIYPNPNPGAFTLQLTGTPAQHLELELFDLAGRGVGRRELEFGSGILNQRVDFGALPAAMYLLRVSADRRVFYTRVAVE